VECLRFEGKVRLELPTYRQYEAPHIHNMELLTYTWYNLDWLMGRHTILGDSFPGSSCVCEALQMHTRPPRQIKGGFPSSSSILRIFGTRRWSFPGVHKLLGHSNNDSLSTSETEVSQRKKKLKSTYLIELNVRKSLVASISQRSEEPRLHNLV
jgi:hypothetical protein